jgi:hypothetical protein
LGSFIEPSDDTLSTVMEAGMLSALLDLRLVKNFAGDWGFLGGSSLGSSEAAPPLTLMPMLWLAVLTVAEDLDRQLPPLNQFLLGFVLSLGSFVAGGVAEPSDESRGACMVEPAGVLSRVVLPLGVVVEGVAAGVVSGGMSDALAPACAATGFGFDFLRGLIPAGEASASSQTCGRGSRWG